ncbi:MAG: TIGR04211 family SH3 domain-containing protein [Desulfobacterales bacterium]|nr:TIGR04211 family SH3 domain-containing protein [Desulfobacterales bacterium]
MKWIRCTIAVFALWAAPAVCYAESAFITDVFEVTLRTGPGIDHKIVSMLRSGQPVAVTEAGDEWSRVVLPDGKEGYVLSRFISVGPPARLSLERVRDAYEALKTEAARLKEENSRLASENQALESQLETVSNKLETVGKEYAALKSESSDVFSLKKRYEQAAGQLQEKTARVNKLEEQVSQLQLNKNIRWFLGGAGVLVLGFLIGFSAKKQRRRSSLL